MGVRSIEPLFRLQEEFITIADSIGQVPPQPDGATKAIGKEFDDVQTPFIVATTE
jgi:hypothetical protein